MKWHRSENAMIDMNTASFLNTAMIITMFQMRYDATESISEQNPSQKVQQLEVVLIRLH